MVVFPDPDKPVNHNVLDLWFKSNSFSITNDYEKRKLAEQRATRKFKGDNTTKDSKGKIGSKKRELKLTLSRALSDEIEKK